MDSEQSMPSCDVAAAVRCLMESEQAKCSGDITEGLSSLMITPLEEAQSL